MASQKKSEVVPGAFAGFKLCITLQTSDCLLLINSEMQLTVTRYLLWRTMGLKYLKAYLRSCGLLKVFLVGLIFL